MSLIKRKIHSLDPVEKQKKHRQVECFMLVDKCLQIPNDDKLILRKAIQDEDDSVLHLLERHRKQGAIKDKDMRQLQIYLRKFIQQYKLDNPKYPIIKISRGKNHLQTQSALKEYNKSNYNKRASLSVSVSMSKVKRSVQQSHIQKSEAKGRQQCVEGSGLGLGNSRKSQIMILSKSKLATPLKSPQRENYFGITPKNFSRSSIKQSMKLNTTSCKDGEKNYEQLIKKRKTQRLKIQANRVSVTIEKEDTSPKKNNASQMIIVGKANRLDERAKSRTQAASFIISDSLLNISESTVGINSAKKSITPVKSINRSISIMNQSLVNHSIDVIQSLVLPEIEMRNDVVVGELLQTISFKMKVDEVEDGGECEVPAVQEMRMLSHQVSSEKLGNYVQMRRASNCYANAADTTTDIHCKDVRKRLFDSSTDNKSQSKLNDHSQQCYHHHEPILNQTQTPLHQIKYQSNKIIKEKLPKCEEIKQNKLKVLSRGKENFNSGQKNQDLQSLKSSFNHSLVRSQAKPISMENISQLINKQNEENNEVLSFYIKSQRNANDLSSQRLLEDSKAFVKSSIREKDERSLKQSKSSRMQFSSRMAEIISERTDRQQSQIASSVSNREKIKGANKLAFWARIQSTINE